MDADYTDDPALLANTLVQLECLLEQIASGICFYVNLDVFLK